MKITEFFKYAIFSLTLLVGVCSFAQNDFQGKAYYISKTSIDMDNFGRPGMSEEQKKRIAERMKSMFEKTYVLTFNKTESIYKEEEKLEAPGQGQGGRFRGMMSSFTGGDQYKNIKDKVFLQDQELFGKQFLIKDSLSQINWVMGSETKQIGQYMCFKATATIADSSFDFTRFRRPPENRTNAQDSTQTKAPKTNDSEKLIQVEAWYTLQIPINQGPGEYWGLPGLILEVNAGRTTVLCSKIVMNPNDKDAIKKPSKGKEVTKLEYQEILEKKMKELRENFRGRGRGGRRG
ncbi:GLPGLI family protein [Hwangdonia lutea]|uniref:GLPGLI family protein n=1 Tax=Hwangdonia lutea TaxID=3075823 RepID=A0AA97ELB9_9FLAO|nr:GLPGLI family protein [Hwangdonia sp. SCSIO 19198]WOD42190.1 GLPGLI family protein [Hwangdonia sp. SCSIO 19198]